MSDLSSKEPLPQSIEGGLSKTVFYELHVAAGARMVPFAGYDMPVQYTGIKAEHLHTRQSAGLFDVSHMGQVLVSGEKAAAQLELLLPIDLDTLSVNQSCYTFFVLPNGGLLDDLIITRRSESEFMLVLNGARKNEGIAHLQQHLSEVAIEYFDRHSLLALQGPMAKQALCEVFPDFADELSALTFMKGINVQLYNHGELLEGYISRSGYTGEDGYELSLPDACAVGIAENLIACADVAWVGLGARDSLRLEAGLCLYGHDLNTDLTPVEAGLSWSIDKSRRKGGNKQGGFLGAEVILSQLDQGVNKKRVGFKVEGRIPVREGADIVDESGEIIGTVTSGGYAPSVEGAVLMGYVDAEYLAPTIAEQKNCFAVVRGKKQSIVRAKMPFIGHKYAR